jgi:hypothetical protein
MKTYVALLFVLTEIMMLMSFDSNEPDPLPEELYESSVARAIAFESYDPAINSLPV